MHGAAQAMLGEFPLDAGEGIVEGVHEQPAHDVQDHDLAAPAGVEHDRAAPGRAAGVVVRAQDAPLPVEQAHGLALVPDVIAAADDIDPGGENFLTDLFRDAEAAGRVLAVGDDEIDAELAAQARQVPGQRLAPGPADDISTEQEFHDGTLRLLPLDLIRSRSLRSR